MRKTCKRVISALMCILILFYLVPASVAASNKAASTVKQQSQADINEILSKMTLRDKLEQMMFVSYRIWKEVPDNSQNPVVGKESGKEPVNITELNDEIKMALTNHHFGGTVLFAENFRDAEQTLRLVADMQQTNQSGGGIPLFVSVDQEGGNVARIGFGTSGVGNMALAATNNPDNARLMARVYGEELSLLGINTDFAPVMDVHSNPANPVIGVRSFSDSPDVVAEYGIAYMNGLHDTNTIATLKHFPGHGNTDADSHTGFPCIKSSLDELKKSDLIPFKKAIDAGADMVMTAHIQYPMIETNTYTSISTGEKVYLPATMSSTILTDLLRKEMGFDGVIVSDALDMAAITENFNVEDVLTLTINSGVNMLILPLVTNTQLFQHTLNITDMAVNLAQSGKISIDRIDDSVRRILLLKQKYGLLEKTNFNVTESQIYNAIINVGSKAHKDVALNIANEALTLLKNKDNAFPLNVKDNEKVLILFADNCASRVGNVDLAKKMLKEKGITLDSQISVMVNTTENSEECVKEASKADHCILVYRTYSTACLDEGTDAGFSSAVFDSIINKRHDVGKKSILVSCQLPYDAARFLKADAVILTYNSAAMRQVPPEIGEGSAYIPNLASGLVACFGKSTVKGVCPVNIPKLNQKNEISKELLYKRNL